MKKLLMTFFVIIIVFGFTNSTNNEIIIFFDDFSSMIPQMISGGVIGAESEYHNIPAVHPKGNWIVSCFKSEGSQRAWRIIKDDNKHIMYQSYISTSEDMKYYYPIVIAGDSLWQDYKLEVKFSPESKKEQSGIIFRYRNDRCFYYLGVKEDKVFISKYNHSKSFRSLDYEILAEKSMDYYPGDLIHVVVDVKGNRIKAIINNKIELKAEDFTFSKGRIGLMSDIPTKYFSVKVTMDKKSHENYLSVSKNYEQLIEKLKNENPKPVIWKKINISGFGAPRSLRFGDLTGNGEIDILVGQVLNHGPKDRNSEVGCLTAINLNGEILWQIGTPDSWHDRVTSDVAFQIYDIDGDGMNEVIYCKGMELIVADGATGKTKYKTKTPINESRPPYNKFPNILGDCLFICNVRGLEKPQDIIIKDRYENFYVYNAKLEMLWRGKCRTGHYPYAWDYDGDGKDEIAIGYSLYDNDGTQIFSLDDILQDHSDGVAIVKLKENQPYVIMNAASDEGLLYYDIKGNILKHHYIGHVQNPAIANLRDDLPGLETITVNFWGNQGIIHLLNSDMEIYNALEPFQQGSPLLPVNWTGKSEEFIVLSPDPNYGGMIDGWGRTVVTFPADGHPDMCYAVLDITGDCRDEIVVWDMHELWIYTQNDNPKQGKLYKPKRNPLYNYSNYAATVSLPGWN